MTKFLQILFFIFIFSFNSCSKDKGKTTIDNKPVIYNDKYSLDINKSYKIFKVTFSSHESTNNFNMEYIYSTDSIVQIKTNTYPPITLVTSYYLNNHVLADSSKSCSYYNSQLSSVTKSYFSYDSNGYLISSTAKNYNSYYDNTPSFTTTYDYTNGNLTKTTFDPKKPTISGKYISYSYNSYQNLINLDTFTGPWLGVLNKNLVQRMYIGGSMSDIPPCSNYQYALNPDGLVEKITTTPCNSQSNYMIITTFEYKIID
jgi:hypothetical protein